MLGNWSFGDYFKKEAIDWAWELIAEGWKFPPNRLYATVYRPGKPKAIRASSTRKRTISGPRNFARRTRPESPHRRWQQEGQFLDDGRHRPLRPVQRNPRGPHPAGDTQGALVNKGTRECIEIWNLVFIQFNANPDGTFSPLPARHVDTGMGFERVTGIIQNTKNFTDFTNAKISNYETDIFRPIFDKLEKLSGKNTAARCPLPRNSRPNPRKTSMSPSASSPTTSAPELCDRRRHQPGNTDRNYVLRRILRRAVRYGRTWASTNPSSTSSWMSSRERWAMCSPKSAKSKSTSRK